MITTCDAVAHRALGTAGALALLATFAGAPPAIAKSVSNASRADLKVSKGSVKLTNGSLSGSFTVANAGKSSTHAETTSALVIRVSHKDVVLARFGVPVLKHAKSFKVSVKRAVSVPAGSYPVQACADQRSKVKERYESNNCLKVGTLTVPKMVSTTTGALPGTTTTPGPGATTTTPGATGTPTTTPPAGPAPLSAPDTTYVADQAFRQDNYWAYVPGSYNRAHTAPIELFVWLHGCYGKSEDDIYNVADYWPGEDYIAIAPIGQEDASQCWLLDPGPATVLSAIANVASHFNINPRKVVIGGYSSGGDLAYRTAFLNPKAFSGLLAMNTSPFRDTGLTQAQALAAAGTTRFHIAHIAHLQDGTYPIAGVRSELDAVEAAGFPVARKELTGHHSDCPCRAASADNDPTLPGTSKDIQDFLIPYLANDWLAPAS